MNTNPLHRHPNSEQVDLLLSDYFKSQVANPWPGAPATTVPSELVAAHAIDTESAPARQHGTSRARFTLAASVMVAIGAVWAFSNGYSPIDRSNTNNPSNPSILNTGTANEKGVLPEIRKSKATDNNPIGPIDFNDTEK